MTITLELKPEIEARLVAQARAEGVPLDAYLQKVIEQATTPEAHRRLALEEFEAALDALAEGSESLPVLPPEAYERESIYGDG
ncbi:MAG: hypothetical protein FJ279_08095 [Planctomycetes bacterium]|nr:hypothetical protein [Planctomycetota bacterium]MBM4078633.1 hypothetical protein [Planctomycetota bacterium]